MKNFTRAAKLLLLFTSLLFLSCTREQNESLYSTTKEFISQGKWSVDYFFEGQDRTAQFSNYEFRFYGNGTLSGNNGTTDFSGNWSMLRDVNRNDVLKIQIATQDPDLACLNDQWQVTYKNAERITLVFGASELRIKKH